jgi:hypothetical protein
MAQADLHSVVGFGGFPHRYFLSAALHEHERRQTAAYDTAGINESVPGDVSVPSPYCGSRFLTAERFQSLRVEKTGIALRGATHGYDIKREFAQWTLMLKDIPNDGQAFCY